MNTWHDTVRQYYRFNKMGKNDFTYRKYFDPLFADMDIKSITKEQIAIARSGINGSPGTVNRYLNYFRAVLMYGYEELGWLDTKPMIKRVKELPKRTKYFTLEDIKVLHTVLPLHLKKPFVFSLLTGVRMSNCFNLKWDDINKDQISIDGTETKNGKGLSVPLNKKCRELLYSIKKESPYVFTYSGRKINRASNTGWYNALKKANLEGFRWHDIRHTWATHHVQNGTPLHTLQHLGGWSDFNIVNRYAHLSKDYLSDACEVSNSLVS
jgi:integrase|tara:strand:- start:510 stop:1310 length:801 start_codon:yes stop_codon:yes gene_type:complete